MKRLARFVLPALHARGREHGLSLSARDPPRGDARARRGTGAPGRRGRGAVCRHPARDLRVRRRRRRQRRRVAATGGRRIAELGSNFIEGGVVREGETLAVVERFDYEIEVADKEAAVAESRARLGEARAELDAERRLLAIARKQAALRMADLDADD